MPLVTETVEQLERQAATLPVADVAGYLQGALGQRMSAYLAGLNDSRQVDRYRRRGGPAPTPQVEQRLREGGASAQGGNRVLSKAGS